MMTVALSNHQDAYPTVQLTGTIRAHEVLAPGSDREMSSHKIWIPPGEKYPPHIHPAPHVIVILEGGGYGNVGDPNDPADSDGYHEFLLRTGDVFFVPGETRHQVGSDDRGMIMLAVSVGSLALTDPKRLVEVP